MTSPISSAAHAGNKRWTGRALTAHYDSITSRTGRRGRHSRCALRSWRWPASCAPNHQHGVLSSSCSATARSSACWARRRCRVAEHAWAADIGCVVNLEANGTRVARVFCSRPPGTTLAESTRLPALAPRPVASSVYDAILRVLPFNSDLTVYARPGCLDSTLRSSKSIPTTTLPATTLANLDPGSVQHHGDNALAATKALAALDLSSQP